MSLYKDASLVMIPSAYSDGRLYSIRPIPEYGSEILTQPVDISVDFSNNAGGVIVDANTFQTFGGGLDGITRDGFVVGKQYRIEIQGTTTSSGFTYGNGSGSGNEYGSGFGVSYFTALNQRLWIRQTTAGITDITTFSIKEVSNIGDFDFSRGSNLAATRVDVNGLIEKGRENHLLHSNNFGTGWFVRPSTTITLNQTDPNGGTSAVKIVTTATGNVGINQTNVTSMGSGNIRTASVWLKGEVGGEVVNFGDATTRTSVTITTEWVRYEGFAIDSAAVFVIYSDNATFYAAFAQYENGLVATDYIETGASTAQAGILEDMPRLDYSGSCPALLLEPQRTNFIKQSEYFNSSEWTINSSTIVDNDSISPQGVRNAARWTSNASGTHIQDSVYVDDPSNFSVFLKYVDYPYIQLYSGASGNFYANFDIENNIIGNSGSFTSNEKIESYGDGWYRISCTFSGVAAGSSVRIGFVNSLTSSWGDLNTSGGGEVLIFGAQCEAGSYPTSYIPTYGSSVTRSQDSAITTFPDDSIVPTSGSTLFFDIELGGLFKETPNVGGFYLRSNDVSLLQFNFTYGYNRIYSNYVNGSSAQIITGVTEGQRLKCAFQFTQGGKLFVNGINTHTTSQDYSTKDIGRFEISKGHSVNQAVLFPTILTDAECIALTTL